MSKRRVLQPDINAPRFRIVRLWRVAASMKGEHIGTAETPSEAAQRVHASSGHVIAVDRRGDIYADNHQPTQEHA